MRIANRPLVEEHTKTILIYTTTYLKFEAGCGIYNRLKESFTKLYELRSHIQRED